MSLFQDKKEYSLKEHVEEFSNPIELSKEDIEAIIIKPEHYPKIFSDNFLNNDKNQFPTKHIIDEIEVFNPNIYNNISKTHTVLGNIYNYKILQSPTSQLNILEQRQNIIKNICENFTDKLDNNLSTIKDNIKESLWFFRPNNEHSDYIYSLIFFQNKYLKFLNKNGPFLTLSNAYKIIISPIMTALSPLIYVLIPFILLRLMKFKLPLKFFLNMMWEQSGMISVPFIKNELMATLVKWFSKGMSIFFYFQGVYYSYQTSRSTVGIVNLFQKKLENIQNLLRVNSSFRDNGKFSEMIGFQEYPENFGVIENKKLDNYSLLTNKGIILKDFYEFIDSKQTFLKILNNIGFFDCYFGIAKLITDKSYFNIPKLITSERPYLNIQGIWHPAIPKEKNVKNSIEFKEDSRNYLLTGPNAAGKSTFIKSIFLNIYLSQTVGFCNSERMEITPFCYLLTGIRNQDSQGSESLFEAEVHKIRDYLDHIKESGKVGKTFSILDEIFTSTNYNEGFSASYGLCKTIGKMPNSLHIVASHYTKLYKLVKNPDYGFKNIRFSVIFDKENILFPYRLENGYSKQFIALRLMKNKNCNDEFIGNCFRCLKKLGSRKKGKKKVKSV